MKGIAHSVALCFNLEFQATIKGHHRLGLGGLGCWRWAVRWAGQAKATNERVEVRSGHFAATLL